MTVRAPHRGLWVPHNLWPPLFSCGGLGIPDLFKKSDDSHTGPTTLNSVAGIESFNLIFVTWWYAWYKAGRMHSVILMFVTKQFSFWKWFAPDQLKQIVFKISDGPKLRVKMGQIWVEPLPRVWQDSPFSYLESFSCKTDFIFGICGPENGILSIKKSEIRYFRFEQNFIKFWLLINFFEPISWEDSR